MAFFIQLVSIWAVLWLFSFSGPFKALKSHALKGRIAFSAGFIIVGTMHLLKPLSLSYMIKDFIPYPELVVIITGIIEIALAILLLIKKYQKMVSWVIIVYLIAILPANIYVAVHNLPAPGGLPAKPWYTWSRLLFQPVYIAWVYFSGIYSLQSRKEYESA